MFLSSWQLFVCQKNYLIIVNIKSTQSSRAVQIQLLTRPGEIKFRSKFQINNKLVEKRKTIVYSPMKKIQGNMEKRKEI